MDNEVEKKDFRSPKEIMLQQPIKTVDSAEAIQIRKLASLQNLKNEDVVVIAKIFCGDQLERLNVKKQMVILEFNSCLNSGKQNSNKNTSYSIQNLTNGFKGQVFKTGEKTFKTDFIQLSQGVNKIELQYYSKDKQHHRQSLEIVSGS